MNANLLIELRRVFAKKHLLKTPSHLQAALDDCHDTLKVGQYSPDSEYGSKLWAEIYVLRELSQRKWDVCLHFLSCLYGLHRSGLRGFVCH
jgi:hypothetical protein